jgi:arylsulfatase A-like enzyme
MSRPNILFVMTDQQAWVNHPRVVGMPVWSGFCGDGISFEQAYTITPLCTPARCSMMTGMFPSAHGFIRNPFESGRHELDDGQKVYGHYLKEAGYRNAFIGKWHCGRARLPEYYGMEGWSLPDYGNFYMSEAYEKYARERGFGPATARIEHNLNHPEWRGQSHVLHHESAWHFMNGAGVLQGPAEAQFITHLASEKLRELARGKQPFSLVTCYWGPHQPYFPSEPYASAYAPESIPEHPSFRDDLKGRPLRHVLHREMNHPGAKAWRGDWSIWQRILSLAYGQQLQTDAAIGGLLKTLDETGLSENTIVIWCADHGDAVGSHGGLWDKSSTMTQEVMRVPFAIRWPKAFKGGQTRSQLISNLDVTATMLAAAGAKVPAEMHSRSLLPLCEDAGAAWSDQLISEHHGHLEQILQRMIVCGKYKYVAALFDGHELYDLEADPYEMRNLIHDPGYAAVKEDMRRRILAHMEARQEKGQARQLMVMLEQGYC